MYIYILYWVIRSLRYRRLIIYKNTRSGEKCLIRKFFDLRKSKTICKYNIVLQFFRRTVWRQLFENRMGTETTFFSFANLPSVNYF